MYLNDPEAPTPPSGYVAVVDVRSAAHVAKTALKWAVGVVAVAVVVAGAALVVHRLEEHPHVVTTLQGSGFDAVIEQESTTVTSVDCPNVPIRPGYVFECPADTGSATTPAVEITEGDAPGHFVWKVVPAPASPATSSAVAG